MECPGCSAANLEGKKFGGDCGTALTVVYLIEAFRP
jgi:hypothetical protein